ncbi:MAG TPA: hypothetical protein V6C58_21135 [Allocoleopsis sp.]
MNKKPLPPPEVIEQTIKELREVCYRFDALNIQLDELIAMVETDIRNSPLTQYRKNRAKRFISGE